MPSDDDLIDAAPCPKCRAPLSVALADLGHLIECPSCGAQSRARRAEPASAKEPESRRPRPNQESRQDRERESDWGDDDERRQVQKRDRSEEEDELEDDRPRRRPRPRPRDDDYEDDRPRRPGQGAAITAAVLNFVFAVIALLEGGCAGIGGIGLLSDGPRGGRGGPFGGPENAGLVFVGFGVCNLIGVGLMIPSGVGLLTRKPFGRTLGFLAAGLGLIYALSIVIGFLVLLGEAGRGPPAGAIFIVLLGVLLWLAYGITNLILLGKVRPDPR